jgi:adenylate cyclase
VLRHRIRLRTAIAVALSAGLIAAGGTVLRLADPVPLIGLRNLVFDQFQRLRPRAYDADAPVRIVDIDDASLARYGQWPWPRDRLAALIEATAAAGAAAIAIDLVLAEPDRSSPEEIVASLPDTPARRALERAIELGRPNDAVLAEALAATGSVTGAILVHGDGPVVPPKSGFAVSGDDPRPALPTFSAVVAPLPILLEASHGLGSTNWLPDIDQVVRTVPLVFAVGETFFPSLSAEALRVAQGASTMLLRASNASGETAYGAFTGLNAVRIGDVTVPTEPNGEMRIHFTPSTPERYVPAWQVLDGTVPPGSLDGRIVLVGTSAPGLFDLRATPLESAVPGVEVHAQAIEQMIAGGALTRPDWASGAEILAFLVATMTVALAAALLASVRVALATGTMVLVALGAASWFAFVRWQMLVDASFPVVGAGLALATSIGLVSLREEVERRRIRTAFGRYLAPAFVEELSRNPERLKLGGEIRPMTILFCDMRSFTTISEGMDAHTLTRFMNAFLTPLTDVILERRGTIDKYMGDAIMAFWNAPLDDPDHAAHACDSALAMLAAIDQFNVDRRAGRVPGPNRDVAIGIGLNGGDCCVGNLGSERRFDYSVIGDCVNVASRMEGQTKAYGVPVLVGESVAGAAPRHAFLEVDRVRVKGKTEAVRLYALWGDAATLADPAFVALRAKLDAMLSAYASGDFAAASDRLDEAEKMAEGRLATVAAIYRERIGERIGKPLPDGWDGSHDLLTK